MGTDQGLNGNRWNLTINKNGNLLGYNSKACEQNVIYGDWCDLSDST